MAADFAILRAPLRNNDAGTGGASGALEVPAILAGEASAFAIPANTAAAFSVAVAATTVMSAPACLRLVHQPEAGQRHASEADAEFLKGCTPCD